MNSRKEYTRIKPDQGPWISTLGMILAVLVCIALLYSATTGISKAVGLPMALVITGSLVMALLSRFVFVYLPWQRKQRSKTKEIQDQTAAMIAEHKNKIEQSNEFLKSIQSPPKSRF